MPIVVLGLGASLRLYELPHFPPFYVDEFTYGLGGWFLLHSQLKTESTFFQLYGKFGMLQEKQLVSPWLDHPALLLLLVALSLYLFKAPGSFDVDHFLTGAVYEPARASLIDILAVRLPFTILNLGTIVLTYLIARRLFGPRIAVISTSFLAFMPMSVLYGRMAFLEHGAIFFTLGAFYLLLRYDEGRRNRYLIAASISGGIAFLSKVIGVVALILLAIFVLKYVKARRLKVLSLISAGLIAAVYPIYAALLNFRLFVAIYLYRVENNVPGLYLLISMLSSGYAAGIFWRAFLDLWLLVGWCGFLCVLILQSKENRLLITFTLVIVALFLILAKPPYYLVFLYPFLALWFGRAYTLNSSVIRLSLLAILGADTLLKIFLSYNLYLYWMIPALGIFFTLIRRKVTSDGILASIFGLQIMLFLLAINQRNLQLLFPQIFQV